MKRLLVLLGIVLFAAPSMAAVFETTGVGRLKFSNLGGLLVSATSSGVATVNGSGGLGHLDTYQITSVQASFNTVAAVTDPIVTAGGIVEVRLTEVKAATTVGGKIAQGGIFGNISGALGATTQGLTPNTLAGAGMVRICLFFTGCNSGALTQTLSGTDGIGNYVGAGVGGLVTIGGNGNIRISLVGAPYTIKTATVFNRTNNGAITTLTRMGFAHGPASLTSSTAATGGVVAIVTPNRTFTVGVPGNSDISGQITTTVTTFTPEPGLLLLLGAGAAGLVVIGRKRLRK